MVAQYCVRLDKDPQHQGVKLLISAEQGRASSTHSFLMKTQLVTCVKSDTHKHAPVFVLKLIPAKLLGTHTR